MKLSEIRMQQLDLQKFSSLTEAQGSALRWLTERGGHGVWTKNGTLMAQGEIAPVMRSTWNRLFDREMVVITKTHCTATPKGKELAPKFVLVADHGGIGYREFIV